MEERDKRCLNCVDHVSWLLTCARLYVSLFLFFFFLFSFLLQLETLSKEYHGRSRRRETKPGDGVVEVGVPEVDRGLASNRKLVWAFRVNEGVNQDGRGASHQSHPGGLGPEPLVNHGLVIRGKVAGLQVKRGTQT